MVDFGTSNRPGTRRKGRARGEVGVAAGTPGVTDAGTAIANAYRGGAPRSSSAGRVELHRGMACSRRWTTSRSSARSRSGRRPPRDAPHPGRRDGVPQGDDGRAAPCSSRSRSTCSLVWRTRAAKLAEALSTDAGRAAIRARARAAATLDGPSVPCARRHAWWWSPEKEALARSRNAPTCLCSERRGARRLPPDHPRNFRLSRSKAIDGPTRSSRSARPGLPPPLRHAVGKDTRDQADLDPDAIGHNRGATGIVGDTASCSSSSRTCAKDADRVADRVRAWRRGSSTRCGPRWPRMPRP